MTDIEETAKRIAHEIQRGVYFAGEYSGFSKDSKDAIENLLLWFAREIKEDILNEIEDEQ